MFFQFASNVIFLILLGKMHIDSSHSHCELVCGYYMLIPIICLLSTAIKCLSAMANLQIYLFERLGLRMCSLELSFYLYLRFKFHHFSVLFPDFFVYYCLFEYYQVLLVNMYRYSNVRTFQIDP